MRSSFLAGYSHMDRHLFLKPRKHSNHRINQRLCVERKDAIWPLQTERNKRFRELQRVSRRLPRSKISLDNLLSNKTTINYFVLVFRIPFRYCIIGFNTNKMHLQPYMSVLSD